ncbi:hypothetical protein N44_02007 [Microcystis aeruginosa NIES-44]|uniref:Uncharacterized protein n=1 Tax=Microcystis aeruginosa NIES-44 TaxID=449439 RepID=A0A0A1VUC2_MICAE|nr:hypothetical protein N44_02007 [Microcystis aeruginosa NIES-44]
MQKALKKASKILPTIVKKVGLIFFTGGYDFKRVISRLSKRLREERDRQLMEVRSPIL